MDKYEKEQKDNAIKTKDLDAKVEQAKRAVKIATVVKATSVIRRAVT